MRDQLNVRFTKAYTSFHSNTHADLDSTQERMSTMIEHAWLCPNALHYAPNKLRGCWSTDRI